MKEIDESKITKHDSIVLPSFKISITNQELDSKMSTLQVQQEVGGLQMKNGCQSAFIELISGLPPLYSLINDG